MPSAAPSPLRVLRLSTPDQPSILPIELENFLAVDALGAEAAAEGGVGLATALFAEARLESSEPAPVALAVGSALVRGIPTAARLSLVTRGVLREGCIDGQVGGGDLARRLASVCDGLLLSAPARPANSGAFCLHLSESGAEYLRLPELDQASPREALHVLGERFGQGAALVLGPARTASFAFAGLTAGEIGREGEAPTSFLGRGGVGARFSGLGLRALVLTAPVHPGEHDSGKDQRRTSEEFARLLRSSPRLAARAEGGTMELLDLHARTAEIGGPADGGVGWAREMARGAREAKTGRHGCKGCPTPCGLVFDRSDGTAGSGPRGARFGALHAVTARLGLDRFGDGLELLARCDDLGLDAKETGLALYAIQVAAERGILEAPSPRGDVGALLARLDEVVGGVAAYSAEFRRGADSLAARFGSLDEIAEARADLLGESVRAEAASLMVRGSDSGRFAGAVQDPGALQRFPEAAWSEGARPAVRDEAGAAALSLCLQEDWIAATDALGICSFSCRALLEDGIYDTSDLASVLLRSQGPHPGERWLALGAAVCELQWRVRARHHAPVVGEGRSRFEEVYRSLRSERSDGRPIEVLRQRLARVRRVEQSRVAPSPIDPQQRSTGTVYLRSFGALADALGAETYPLTLELPATLTEVLRAAVGQRPGSKSLLFAPDGVLLPATHRDGVRLFGDSSVTRDEILDLVLALRGG